MADKKYGCIIYEDVFARMDNAFTDEQLGRILRAGLKYGFFGTPPALEDALESYACSDLISIFDRNKESYTEASVNGKVGNAMRYATDLSDFKDRLNQIEDLTNYAKHEWINEFRNKYPTKCR